MPGVPPLKLFSTAAALQDFLLQEAGPGALVVVPHQRLAQQLWQRQRLAQLQAGRPAWDLRYAPPGAAGGGEASRQAQGPLALPGSYRVRLTAAGRSYAQPVEVALDPRSTAPAADLQKQFELSMNAVRAMERAARELPAGAARTRVIAALSAVLSVAQSADRTPPAAAYEIYAEALKELETR